MSCRNMTTGSRGIRPLHGNLSIKMYGLPLKKVTTMPLSRLTLALLLFLPLLCAGYEDKTGEAAGESRFTFSWPLGESTLKPRGASTRGVPVNLDTAPTEEWKRLREPGLEDFERDRRAILAMAGPYRVSFDFLEIARFDPSLKGDAPYQSWATEYVYVGEDHGNFIALQHILVMRVLQNDGTESEPMVMRHWRQEWKYQAQRLLAYEGNHAWSMRPVPIELRKGSWVQSVYQVDDSPRYAGAGRWLHSDSFSTWISDETWRPLPRREWSVRSDYQVLAGTNRHTVTQTGWLQEENNLKLALGAGNAPRVTLPYVAREYGVARYERIKDVDFSAGQEYFDRTEPFWSEVRSAWRDIGEREGHIEMQAAVDQGQLFMPFFQYAEKLAMGKTFDPPTARAFIERTLRRSYLRQP